MHSEQPYDVTDVSIPATDEKASHLTGLPECARHTDSSICSLERNHKADSPSTVRLCGEYKDVVLPAWEV